MWANLELESIQTRLALLNDWVGEVVARFKPYELAAGRTSALRSEKPAPIWFRHGPAEAKPQSGCIDDPWTASASRWTIAASREFVLSKSALRIGAFRASLIGVSHSVSAWL